VNRSEVAACPLMAGPVPKGCDWCGKALAGRQKRWCSTFCTVEFQKHHVWSYSREAALRRDGWACVTCGSKKDLEVNHIQPRRGRGYDAGCAHHQENLETLCHDCHVKVTKQQRRDRWR